MCTLNGGKVYVNSFTGLQAGNKTPKTLTIYVNATYGGSGPTCGTGYKWTAAVFTGNAFGRRRSRQVFPGNTNDTQTAACNYTVALTPAQATVGASTTMTATFGNATNSTASFNTVTLTAPSTITLGSVTLPMGTTATIAGAGDVVRDSHQHLSGDRTQRIHRVRLERRRGVRRDVAGELDVCRRWIHVVRIQSFDDAQRVVQAAIRGSAGQRRDGHQVPDQG